MPLSFFFITILIISVIHTFLECRVVVAAATTTTTFVPGRTQTERDGLCTEYNRIKSLFDRRDEDEIFAIRLVRPWALPRFPSPRNGGGWEDATCPQMTDHSKIEDNDASCKTSLLFADFNRDGFIDTDEEYLRLFARMGPFGYDDFDNLALYYRFGSYWNDPIDISSASQGVTTLTPEGQLLDLRGVCHRFRLDAYAFAKSRGMTLPSRPFTEDDLPLEARPCDDIRKQWSFGPRGALTLVDENGIKVPGYYFEGLTLLLTAAVEERTFDVTGIVEPIECPCGMDNERVDGDVQTQSTCVDIDECQEEHGCPDNSFCINTAGDYECQCLPGYADVSTGGVDVAKSGTCVLAPTLVTFDTTFNSFKISLSNNLLGDVKVTLYYVSDGSGARIPVQRHSKRILSITDVSQIDEITFDSLQPGSPYQVEVNPDSVPDIYYSEIITTKCYCSDSVDDSGRPMNFRAFQKGGYIMFEFTDNSRCEDAYSFSRGPPGGSRLGGASSSLSSRREVFTPDYYYFSNQECTLEPYAPGRQAADDLRISNLIVGESYTYQVRAAAKQIYRSSLPSSYAVTVEWEASIDGKVTLKKEAGFLPVQGVSVEYRLEDLDFNPIELLCSVDNEGWCLTSTSSSGKFKINLSLVDDALDNFNEYPLRMRFFKQTGDIFHRFLCDDATRDCTIQLPDVADENATEALLFETNSTTDGFVPRTTVTYLSHLDFDEPVHVIDDTTVSFRGRLTVAGTEGFGASHLGCPIADAEVCLTLHEARNQYEIQEPVCVRTDALGDYVLPAVIGTKVSPTVNYNDHVFEPVDPDHMAAFADGILIVPSQAYEGFNMKDITQTNLTVEVAGGLCDNLLGQSTVKLRMQGCPTWEGEELVLNTFREHFEVIAQLVDLEVTSIKDFEGNERVKITRKLEGSIESIDLRELDDEESDEVDLPQNPKLDESEGKQNSAVTEAEKEAEQEINFKRVRFQHNGEQRFNIQVMNTKPVETGSCGSDSASQGVDSYSYHVIPTLTEFAISISVYEDFGYDIPICTSLPENTTVSVKSFVGMQRPSDNDWFEKKEQDGSLAGLVKSLKTCSDGCSLPLDEDGKTSIILLSGPPNRLPDYTKPLFVTATQSGITHKADFVVEGDYEISDKFSVALPTHEPILVLRDPPGGASYAYYEKVMTTIRVELENYERFLGLDVSGEVHLGVDMEVGTCAGLGIQACKDLLKAKFFSGFDGDTNQDFLTSLEDKTTSGAAISTWSYRTSDDEWLAGKASDVFLVPNINLKFKNVTEVKFISPEECAVGTANLKFVVKSDENKPAIGFLSRFTVDTVELPRLQRLRNASQLVLDLNCDDTPNTALCNRTAEELNILNTSISSWEAFLARHDSVADMAVDGRLNGSVPHTWFDQIKDINGSYSGVHPAQHYSGLVPKSLADGAVRVWSPEEGSDSEELERTNQIKFDGGGSELRFELKRDKLEQHTKLLGKAVDNVDSASSFGGGVTGEFNGAGQVIGGSVAAHFVTKRNRRHTGTDSDGEETTIGFVLNDPDSGDVFDVEVFLDPRYGTFVFHTASGQSRCPREDGTVARESPFIKPGKFPGVAVSPDEPLLFEVELSNRGISRSAFQLFTDHRENSGLLGHFVNGDTLAVPQQYDRLEPDETIKTTIAITRGPLLYDYPAITLFFRSACENVRNIGDGNLIALGDKVSTANITLSNVIDPVTGEERIRFAEPCPRIEWAGKTARMASFVINLSNQVNNEGAPPYSLDLVLKNPEAQHITYAQAVADPRARLQDAGIWFRRASTIEWIRALHRPFEESASSPIDLTKMEEDDYGFMYVSWDVSYLADGEYEVEARTLCSDPTNSLPADFNMESSRKIHGVIDRVRPELFSVPSPTSLERLVPGQKVRFEFSETIDCTRPHTFAINVAVSSFPDRQFDNTVSNNLAVLCEDRTISVTLDPYQVNYVDLRGSALRFKITNVKDVNGNVMRQGAPILHDVQYSSFGLRDATVTFQVETTASCTSIEGDTDAADDLIENTCKQIAKLAALPKKRVDLGAFVCVDTGGSSVLAATVMVKPWTSWRKSKESHLDSVSGYYSLLAKVTSGSADDIQSVSEPNVLLGTNDQRRLQGRKLLTDGAHDAAAATLLDTLGNLLDEQEKQHEKRMEALKIHLNYKLAAKGENGLETRIGFAITISVMIIGFVLISKNR